LDVRSAEQFSILHLARPGISSYSSVEACLEGLRAVPTTGENTTAVQVNLPLGLLKGGTVASERETSQQQVFASLKAVIDLVTSATGTPKDDTPPPVQVFVLCRRGVDSVTATQLLLRAAREGYFGEPTGVVVGALRNVEGGLTAWSVEVDTSMVMY
jgi:rhodanese-related sulfurtransferase